MVHSSPQKEDEEHQKHQEQEYGHRNLHDAYIISSIDTILRFETLARLLLPNVHANNRQDKKICSTYLYFSLQHKGNQQGIHHNT